jgi:replicative superfamily II helicase
MGKRGKTSVKRKHSGRSSNRVKKSERKKVKKTRASIARINHQSAAVREAFRHSRAATAYSSLGLASGELRELPSVEKQLQVPSLASDLQLDLQRRSEQEQHEHDNANNNDDERAKEAEERIKSTLLVGEEAERRERRLDTLSAAEARRFLDKYGIDYGAIARDIRLNRMQYTQAQIRKRLKLFAKNNARSNELRDRYGLGIDEQTGELFRLK